MPLETAGVHESDIWSLPTLGKGSVGKEAHGKAAIQETLREAACPLALARAPRPARLADVQGNNGRRSHVPRLEGRPRGCYGPPVPSNLVRTLSALELEERLLNAGACIALLSVFLPWIGGDWLGGDSVSYSGFNFYTGFLGVAIFLLHLFLVLLTLVPLLGGPALVKKRYRELVRLLVSTQALILVLAVLSVLMRVTFEFTRMEVLFGIYICLAGTILAFAESLQRYVVQRRSQPHAIFHHPEDQEPPEVREELRAPPPPPPPPPPAPEPEDHRFHP